MEGERKRSKGGFLHFFDWNGKSRKKLFSNNSELLEGSNMPRPRPDATEVDDRRTNSSNKGSSDFSCASSVTSDEAYGSRAPGVVARLMGLDSLPISTIAEPYCNPFFDSCLLKPSQYDMRTTNNMDYLHIPNKQEKYSGNSVESGLHKVQNRPIERFQTEAIPPKSAKSIPITHHKLMSPIKSPAFIPTKNVAYIVEAAAKIIEASPRATTNVKVPLIGTSSVPLRIRDLKQKMEAAHVERPHNSRKTCAPKNRSGQKSDRKQGGSVVKSEGLEKGISNSLRNKGKPVPPATQAKPSGQRGEGSMSRSNSFMKQKDRNEFKSNHSLKRQPETPNTVQKRISESGMKNVLQQNNHKQNCVSNKDGSCSKNSVPALRYRKNQPMSGPVRSSRIVNKVVERPEITTTKADLALMDSEKEKTANIPQKKWSVNGNLENDGHVSLNIPFDADTRSIKCNVTIDGSMNLADNMKTGTDVVSFTFTSPIKKAMPDTHLSTQTMTEYDSSVTDIFGSDDYLQLKSPLSCLLGLNAIGGDALGVLLEKKLRELANKVESSRCNVVREETSTSSVSSLQKLVPMHNAVSASRVAQERMFQIVPDKDKLSEEMEELGISGYFSETGKECEDRHPSPVSILEPSFASGSSSYINGGKHCSPSQDEERFSGISGNEYLEVESEAELSDSACSVDVVRKHITRGFTSIQIQESSDWEIHYVRDILSKAEPNFKDFALGQTPNVITPNLFYHLENQENGMDMSEENSKLARKVLFDCISEYVDFKCGQLLVGSCKAWARLWMLFQRKDWLAEELYKVILGWKSMGDLMVDELVDKDMSTQYGKWVDFNIEAFKEGVEIEKGVVASLVDELVSDLLLL